MTVIADTLQAKKRLLEAGFTDEKAEGIVEIFRGADAQIATKLDLELFRKDVKGDIGQLHKEMHTELSGMKTELADMKVGLADMKVELADVKNSVKQTGLLLNNRIIKTQLGSAVAIIGILSALRYFM